MSQNNDKRKEPLLNVKEASELFNIRVGRLRWEIFYKRIPVYKIGGSVFLRASDLELWIQSSRRGSK